MASPVHRPSVAGPAQGPRADPIVPREAYLAPAPAEGSGASTAAASRTARWWQRARGQPAQASPGAQQPAFGAGLGPGFGQGTSAAAAKAAAPWADLALAVIGMVAALVAAVVLPERSITRLSVAIPALCVLPGFLLLQLIVVPRPTGADRGEQALIAIGMSPAVVGLLALSTAAVDGGFRTAPILATVTCGCAAVAVMAYGRRLWHERHPRRDEPKGRPAAPRRAVRPVKGRDASRFDARVSALRRVNRDPARLGRVWDPHGPDGHGVPLGATVPATAGLARPSDARRRGFAGQPGARGAAPAPRDARSRPPPARPSANPMRPAGRPARPAGDRRPWQP